MYLFYFFAVISIVLGVLSLRGGFRFSSYVRQEAKAEPRHYAPYCSVIAPCRGLEQGLRENMDALFRQDYPAYELLFVTSTPDDSAVTLIQELIAGDHNPGVSARLVFAGDATDSGQKVHNLRVATGQVAAESEVLVFVDTDARPPVNWLRSLVSPLDDVSSGASTGYRWFLPVTGGFASQLRSVWNASIASSLGADTRKNFCWGGSTAIRRELFQKLQVRELWRGSVSDDFTLTRILQEARLPIHFVPACLVPSYVPCSFRELLEFSNRQLKITRAYAPHLWKPVLLGSFLFCGVFFGGLAIIIVKALAGDFLPVAACLLAIILLLGAAKGLIRLRAVAMPLGYRRGLRNSLPAHLFLWPVASALFLVNSLAAAFSRRIVWRGITYDLRPFPKSLARNETAITRTKPGSIAG
jgi:cellulose synthase/poly-beta-1,6-N-acetylglucosamine synthase-like glycosyltransferase